MHAPNSISAGAPLQTRAGELTTFHGHPSWISGKGRERKKEKGEREMGRIQGRE